MTINYDKLKKEAAKLNISVFLLIRRFIGYGKNVNKGMCKNCEYVCIPTIKKVERMQCTIIGVGDDFYADINPEWCCKKGYKLCDEERKVITNFLNKTKED